MPRQRATVLTDRERDLLQRVRRHETSKEIARATGLSERQVNRALDSARVKLGAADRTKAALLLEQLEEGERYPGGLFPLSPRPTDGDEAGMPPAAAPHVADASVRFVHEVPPDAALLPETNSHDLIPRIAAALKLAVLILAAVVLAIVTLQTLTAVGRANHFFH